MTFKEELQRLHVALDTLSELTPGAETEYVCCVNDFPLDGGDAVAWKPCAPRVTAASRPSVHVHELAPGEPIVNQQFPIPGQDYFNMTPNIYFQIRVYEK